MKKNPLIFLSLLILGFAIGVGIRQFREPPQYYLTKQAPDFTSVSLFDETRTISKLDITNHSVTMVTFFASWCGICRMEHDDLIALSQDPDLFMLGVNMKDKKTNVLEWLREDGNPYDQIAFDPQGDVAVRFGVIGTPEIFLIDSTGEIRYHHIGRLDIDEVKSMITKIRQG